MPHKKQIKELGEKVGAFVTANGAILSAELEKNSRLLLLWLGYLNSTQRTGSADSLLDGTASAIRECAACIALGLVRPALFAMRAQIDMIFSWLYFKDHPVEWAHVNATGEGFKLKKEIFDYLSNYCRPFSTRHGLLRQVITRQHEDMYRLLSAHIHSQSDPVLPTASNLLDVVSDLKICKECVDFAGHVDEYTSDVLMAVYADKWHSIPKPIVEGINSRFVSNAQRVEFYKSA